MKKHKNLWLYVVLVVLGINAIYSHMKIADLESYIENTRNYAENESISLRNNISNIYQNVDAQLEKEASFLSHFEVKEGTIDTTKHTVMINLDVVPKELKCGDVSLHAMWARRHGTKFNGAPYIIQRAGEAVYSDAGKAELKQQIAYYMNNAKTIKEGLKDAGYTVFGGVNAPYIWLKTPNNMTSWEFFDYLLENANVVGTPGSGFGPSGEGYFRLTAFGSYENTVKALERIKNL